MAVRLGDLLVSQGLITEPQLQEGLRSQQLYGGRLGTNLVELGYVSEEALAKLLSEQLGIPCASPADFEGINKAVLQTLTVKTVEKHRIVPIARDNRRLTIAMADPTDLKLIDEISFSTGCAVTPVIAPEVLLLYAMERLYGIARSSRYLRLTGAAGGDFEVVQAGSAKYSSNEESSDSGVEVQQRGEFFDISQSDFKQKRYTLGDASTDLAAVNSHEDAFDVLRRFVRVHFDQMAIFVFRGENVAGWVQAGCRLSDNQFRQLTFPLASSVLFSEGCRSAAPYIGHVPVTETDTRLFQALGIPTNKEILFVPVMVNNRPITVILAAGSHRGEIKDRVLMFDTLAKKTSYAYQILYLKQRILGKAVL